MEVAHGLQGLLRSVRGFGGYRQVKAGPSNVRLSIRTFSTTLRYEVKAARPDTPAKDNIVLDPPAVYVSSSHDPWFNLSYEDWLLRHTPASQPVLFLYRNIPCVVIGRNQNPWKETTPKYLDSRGLPLVRRRSGGGTVYHDLGNTNFSILLPRELFTRSHGAELVARAIRESLGVSNCTVNDRNDVVVKTENGNLKVSGSAYKIVQHRAYHHGTMLISSSLDDLGQSLKSSSPNLETKGIASFRSAVSTLNAHRPPSSPLISHDDFVAAVRKEFQRVYSKDGKSINAIEVRDEDVTEPKIWKGVEELKSWDWKYGQSPEFTNVIEGDLSFGRVKAELLARHAVITSMSLSLVDHSYGAELDQDDLNDLAGTLIGRNYATLEGEEAGLVGESEVVEWLKGAM